MSDSLADCLDALAATARDAGMDEAIARAEGEALAATVAERSKGAFVDWCQQVGKPGATEEFFVAAKQGNRFRAGPTPLMGQLSVNRSEHAPAYAKALGEVALAATLLGQPGPEAVGTATMATSAQLGEARTLMPSSTAPGAFDLPTRQPVPGVGDEMLDQVRRMGDQVRRQLEAINLGTANLGAGTLLPDAPPSDTSALPSAPADADASQVSDAQTADRRETAATASETSDESADAQQDEEPTKTVEELLAELDGMIGLENVKGEIHRQAAVLRVEGLRKKAGLETPTITRHLVFNGNPGTGKTTVARLVAGIYRALGLLSKGQLVEVDRSELVAGYLGQTATKTADKVKEAEGGVLFIDEAYSLSGDQYGKESIDTLVKEMEDKRDDLVVIVAGYPLPMAIFIAENPGLESRFRTHIEFQNYTDDELVAIFKQMADGADFDAGEAVLARLREILAEAPRGPSFGNARYVRNMLEAAIGHHAWRLRDIKEPTLEQLRSLEADDLVVPTDDEPEEPVVAEDGTLLPPADAEPPEVVDALDPTGAGPIETGPTEVAPTEVAPIETTEPTVETVKPVEGQEPT
jgi:SpoVK/Ycf46/Vps4 family AAA+-type ATPase